MRLVGGLPGIRAERFMNKLRASFRVARVRFGMRVIHYSVQQNHVHLIVEAADKESLTEGMRGLSIRFARGINRILSRRRGRVIGERYHARPLTLPRMVRNAVRYVLLNWRHHGARESVFGAHSRDAWDPCSSAVMFPGWIWAPRDLPCAPEVDEIAGTVASPKQWLLTIGWRRPGPIDALDVPWIS
jgi:REP element-mobilizing transposase RayT